MAAGRPRISVHQAGKCHIVDELVCHAPTKSRLRSKQPRFVMAARGHLNITDNVATIHP